MDETDENTWNARLWKQTAKHEWKVLKV